MHATHCGSKEWDAWILSLLYPSPSKTTSINQNWSISLSVLGACCCYVTATMLLMYFVLRLSYNLVCWPVKAILLQPTLQFFKNGKKAGEVIGADVELLKDTMEALYKWRQAVMLFHRAWTVREDLCLKEIYHVDIIPSSSLRNPVLFFIKNISFFLSLLCMIFGCTFLFNVWSYFQI